LEVHVKRFALLLTCVAVAGLAVAEPPAAKPAADPKAADAKGADAKTAPTKGPRIGVEPESFDFGKALQNKTLTKEFSLRNFGNEDLVISEVTTTCGCTVADLATKTLKPGASTPLTVKLDTRSNQGKLERQVSIVSNDPQKKTLMIKVMADVESGAGTGAETSAR
jgi:hypothetical protein